MSTIYDALRQAQERGVSTNPVETPTRYEPRLVQRQQFPVIGFLVFTLWVVMVAAVLAIFQSQKKESEARDAKLAERIEAVDKEHDEFMERVHTDQPYFDVRMELGLTELKSKIGTLEKRLASLEKSPSD